MRRTKAQLLIQSRIRRQKPCEKSLPLEQAKLELRRLDSNKLQHGQDNGKYLVSASFRRLVRAVGESSLSRVSTARPERKALFFVGELGESGKLRSW